VRRPARSFVLVLRRHRGRGGSGAMEYTLIAASNNPAILTGMTPEVEQLLAERDRLLVERDELRALVARQFQGLADLRTEIDEAGRTLRAELERNRRELEAARDQLRAEMAANIAELVAPK